MTELKLNSSLEKVWDNLVFKIENNPGVWDRPWFMDKAGGSIRPVNHISGRAYSGFNIMQLEVSRIAGGFNSNRWITFNQCSSLNGMIEKGSKGSPIIVFSPPKFKETEEIPGKIKREMIRAPFFGSAYVFNLDQTTIKDESIKAPEKTGLMSIPEVEMMIKNSGAVIHERISDKAYYAPGLDSITIPMIDQFKTLEGYYGTKFHELIHWTGHKDRLNRLKDNANFGSESYSREELIAEIGSVFLKTETGISDKIDNAAAYIKNWWAVIKEDKGSLIEAGGKGQKGAEYILKSRGPIS
jgi:antirestriction protein ArdC